MLKEKRQHPLVHSKGFINRPDTGIMKYLQSMKKDIQGHPVCLHFSQDLKVLPETLTGEFDLGLVVAGHEHMDVYSGCDNEHVPDHHV